MLFYLTDSKYVVTPPKITFGPMFPCFIKEQLPIFFVISSKAVSVYESTNHFGAETGLDMATN